MKDEGQYFRPYSIKEVSNFLDIREGTLRQWETDFPDILIIPRDERNYRYYTEIEIDTLKKIKELRDKDLSIKAIREILSSKTIKSSETAIQPTVQTMTQNEVIETLKNIQNTLDNLPAVKEVIISEIKEEIRNDIKEEVRREAAAALQTVTAPLSEEIEALSENHKKEIQKYEQQLIEVNNHLRQANEHKQEKSFFRKLFPKRKR